MSEDMDIGEGELHLGRKTERFTATELRDDDKPAVLIADLPDREDEHFQLVTYGLYALKHSNNNGLRFKDFRVPRAASASALAGSDGGASRPRGPRPPPVPRASGCRPT